jgi:hypothetical protein
MRLQAAREAGSNWHLLFQDFDPIGQAGHSSTNSKTGLPIIKKGEQFFIDLSGKIHKVLFSAFSATILFLIDALEIRYITLSAAQTDAMFSQYASVSFSFEKRFNQLYLCIQLFTAAPFKAAAAHSFMLFYDFKLRNTVSRQDFFKLKIRGQIRDQHQKLPHLYHFQRQSTTKRVLTVFRR